MKTWFFFIDGLGIAPPDSRSNPFSSCRESFLYKLIYDNIPGWTCLPVDACLGVDGLPQSGTGQIALVTGKNASAHLGKHHGPYPHTSQRAWLTSDSIIQDCDKRGFSWDMLNVYPERYFQALETRKIRMSTFGFLQTLNRKSLHRVHELADGFGFPPSLNFEPLKQFADLSNPGFPDGSYSHLLNQFNRIDLGITDNFFLDHLGHKQNLEGIVNEINTISTFLEYIHQSGNKINVIICSDHGNSEDISTSKHTFNPVPLIFNFPVNFVPSDILDLRVLINFSLSGKNERIFQSV